MASKLGKALGFDMGGMPGGDAEDSSDALDEAPASAKEPKAGLSAETMAMKMFEKASTPEAKVTAFKALLEACGVGGSDY